MQLDMHYHGTYALARAAGLKPDAARIIGTCAQFVDDNVAGVTLEFKDGAHLESVATAHHPLDMQNLDLDDQRKVWIPFHFLPGNIGLGFTERLKCRMDSPIARQMVENHLSLADKPYALALMGIAAHVYADTFSHYGFAGVSSRGNKVDNDSFQHYRLSPEMRDYILTKQRQFRDYDGAQLHPNFRKDVRERSFLESKATAIATAAAEEFSGALGHGSVATFPDRPYLVWSFEYERDDAVLMADTQDNPRLSHRNNPATFLEGCEALHRMFATFAGAAPHHASGDGRDFASIRNAVLEILQHQDKKEGRIDKWQNAARTASVFGQGNEPIPDYDGESWNDEWAALNDREDASDVIDRPVWHFYQAAAIHRTYVLRDLLPAHGIIVD